MAVQELPTLKTLPTSERRTGLRRNNEEGVAKPALPHTQSRYMPQLDALRALAAFAVLFFHFYIGNGGAQGNLVGRIPWGEWGVHLFFVLSGFLITDILIKCRDTGSERKHQLRQFYIRRSLRIFPLFYLVTFIAALLNVYPVRETLFWNLTYTSNIYFALRGSFNGPISHFWSLAVEEQFYLIWPCLMLFLPRRRLFLCVALAIILSPVYKILGGHLGLNSIALSAMMISCLDFLGMGALLAICRHRDPVRFDSLAHRKIYTLFGLILLVAMVALVLAGSHSRLVVIANMIVPAVFFAWLIHKGSVGFGGGVGRLLETKPLRYCGKISYGTYIYHPFMVPLVINACRLLHISFPQRASLILLLLTTVTLIVASCSWYLFERPITDLRRHFDYAAA